MSNWWADKLAGRPTQQQQVPAYNPSTVQTQQVPAYQQTQQQVLDGRKKLDNVSFSDALALAQAGQIVSQGDPKGAARFEKDSCPECGSNNYFHRHNISGAGGSAGGRVINTNTGQMVGAAPLCMDCGFRGGIIPQQIGELETVSPDLPVWGEI